MGDSVKLHAVNGARAMASAEGEASPSLADSVTGTRVQDERKRQQRELAQQRKEAGRVNQARFWRAACEQHPRKQAGVAEMCGVNEQHFSEMCRGIRPIPSEFRDIVHQHSPRVWAALQGAENEAYGTHRDEEPATESPQRHATHLTAEAAGLAYELEEYLKDGVITDREFSSADGRLELVMKLARLARRSMRAMRGER